MSSEDDGDADGARNDDGRDVDDDRNGDGNGEVDGDRNVDDDRDVDGDRDPDGDRGGAGNRDGGGEGGYVHDPATFEGGEPAGADDAPEDPGTGGAVDGTAGAAGAAAGTADGPGPAEEAGSASGATAPGTTGAGGEQSFGPGGWLLVALLVVCLFVIPGVVLLRPPGLPFEVAFLVLPLLPGFLLGGAAVWTAVRSRQP